ncbi:MAG: GNAT family N-acetyltransferase [Candidatus Aenigmarchaeota archaeon]|nr:GNAT family N-acetyltransferase [Candidatus Aenigmarchaeota archaeon]
MIPTKIPGFELRFAGPADVPLLLAFIRELAGYEKLLHEVTATEAALQETLFGHRRVAEAVLGFYEKKPVSFAIFFHNYSTFLGRPGLYLEDIFVKPEVRGKGFGKAMLAYLACLAKERGCGRFEWWVLDWNKPAIGFYQKLGAVPMADWTVYRLAGKGLAKLAAEF